MHYKITILSISCLLNICKSLHVPEVYEKQTARTLDSESFVTPPMFNYHHYQKTMQVNPQRIRYQQQQEAERIMRAKRLHVPIENVQQPLIVKVEESTFSNPHQSQNNTPTETGLQNSKKYSLVDEGDFQSQKRLDGSLHPSSKPLEIPIIPSATDHIDALRSLMGKSPEKQLHGLQQLLRDTDFGENQMANEEYGKIHLNVAPLHRAPAHPGDVDSEDIIVEGQQKALSQVQAQQEDIAHAQKAESDTRGSHEVKNMEQEVTGVEWRQHKHPAFMIKKQEEGNFQKDLKYDPHRIVDITRLKNTHKYNGLQQEVPPLVIPPVHLPKSTHPTYAMPSYEAQSEQNTAQYLNHEEDIRKFRLPRQFPIIEEAKNEPAPDDEPEITYAAKYEFGYRIHDDHHGNDFGHKEHQDGKTTKGVYHVLLPDGRTQTVAYFVDPSGYHADVSYHKNIDNQ